MLGFADFYALMPSDNSSPIIPGLDVAFPNNGPSSGVATRLSPTQFMLPVVGTYLVQFHLEVVGSSQLVITLNSIEEPSTIVGDADEVVTLEQAALITTAAANTVLTIRNPTANTVNVVPAQQAPSAGFQSTSAHLVITRYA